jgi:hypothetical protein
VPLEPTVSDDAAADGAHRWRGRPVPWSGGDEGGAGEAAAGAGPGASAPSASAPRRVLQRNSTFGNSRGGSDTASLAGSAGPSRAVSHGDLAGLGGGGGGGSDSPLASPGSPAGGGFYASGAAGSGGALMALAGGHRSRKQCGVDGCGTRFDSLAGLKERRTRHYCGRCQQLVCLAHTAFSPHGATGDCGHDSRCVCGPCFADFAPEYRAFLAARNTLPPAAGGGGGASASRLWGKARDKITAVVKFSKAGRTGAVRRDRSNLSPLGGDGGGAPAGDGGGGGGSSPGGDKPSSLRLHSTAQQRRAS